MLVLLLQGCTCEPAAAPVFDDSYIGDGEMNGLIISVECEL